MFYCLEWGFGNLETTRLKLNKKTKTTWMFSAEVENDRVSQFVQLSPKTQFIASR